MENLNLNENDMMEEVVVEVCEYPETNSGSGIGKLAIGLGVAALAGVAAIVVKNRKKIAEKIEERKIARWERKGYAVYKITDVSKEEEHCSEE